MNNVSLRAEFVEKTSKEGNKYYVVEVYITDNVKKIVFLDPAEKELILQQINNNKSILD